MYTKKESSKGSNEREKWLCMDFCASLAPGFTHLEQSKWHATCSARWSSNSKHIAECTWHIIFKFFFLLFLPLPFSQQPVFLVCLFLNGFVHICTLRLKIAMPCRNNYFQDVLSSLEEGILGNLIFLGSVKCRERIWNGSMKVIWVSSLGVKSLTCKELCFPTSLLSGIFTVSMGWDWWVQIFRLLDCRFFYLCERCNAF